MEVATKKGTATVDVVSSTPGKHLVLEPSTETHDASGRRHLVERGRVIKFSGGKAKLPVSWKDDFEATTAYGNDVWYADDFGAPIPTSGVKVVDGSLGANYRSVDHPPTSAWDDTGAREIRRLVLNGQVRDLDGAMLYELSHKNRSQVIAAISQARRGGEDTDQEPEPQEQSESFHQPVPPDAGGV